jgi:hypothetical protein
LGLVSVENAVWYVGPDLKKGILGFRTACSMRERNEILFP